MTEAVNPKHGPRPPVELRLMYSTKNHSGETRMVDGMVTNLSHRELGMRVNAPVTPGIERMIFSARGENLLHGMETRAPLTSGRRLEVEIRKMNLRSRTGTERGIIFFESQELLGKLTESNSVTVF
jgi:hypothetical protein